MTLAALMSAQLPSSDGSGDGLAALLPMAGMTVLERQAQDAAAVGAAPLLILVDAMPSALTAAIDRIRERGQMVIVVRDGAGVMAALAEEAQRVLLVADGLIAPRALWVTMAQASAPRLLSVSDTPATATLERIDAERRWAGLALVNAEAVAALADLPADWDPQLALLRGAIQAEAPSIACEPQLFERGDVAQLDRAGTADAVEQRLLSTSSEGDVGLVHAGLAMPFARAAARQLLRGQQSGLASRLIALAGGSGACLAVLSGYPWIAVAAAVIALMAGAAAETISAFRPEGRALRWMAYAGDVALFFAVPAAHWATGAAVTGSPISWLALGLVTAQLLLLGRWLADRCLARPAIVFDNGSFWLMMALCLTIDLRLLALSGPLAAAFLLLAVFKSDNVKAV